MSTVFVIHGVSNRDEPVFRADVAKLGQATDPQRTWVPIYWGDLGANDRGLDQVLPPPANQATLAAIASTLQRLVPVRAQISAEVLSATIVTSLAERGRVDRDLTESVPVAVSAVWTDLSHLPALADRALLDQIGADLAEVMLQETGGGRFAVRRSGPDLAKLFRPILRSMDRLLGRTVQLAAGSVNELIREHAGPAIMRFLGDAFVYQRHRKLISARVLEVIERVIPAPAREPIDIVAHSFGGVISFDLAVRGSLRVRRLFTFGSQPALFHLIDPRTGLEPWVEKPVDLPDSIGAWMNFWEPLDPLAFVASKLFRLHGGAAPLDQELEHLASFGLWTHSAYWESPDIASALAKFLE